MLGKFSVPGRPTSLDDSRARAYCACSRCGWGLFGHFFLDTSQKVRRFSRGVFRYAVTRVTNVTIGQAVASGSATKYRSDDQENTLRVMTSEETQREHEKIPGHLIPCNKCNKRNEGKVKDKSSFSTFSI